MIVPNFGKFSAGNMSMNQAKLNFTRPNSKKLEYKSFASTLSQLHTKTKKKNQPKRGVMHTNSTTHKSQTIVLLCMYSIH